MPMHFGVLCAQLPFFIMAVFFSIGRLFSGFAVMLDARTSLNRKKSGWAEERKNDWIYDQFPFFIKKKYHHSWWVHKFSNNLTDTRQCIVRWAKTVFRIHRQSCIRSTMNIIKIYNPERWVFPFAFDLFKAFLHAPQKKHTDAMHEYKIHCEKYWIGEWNHQEYKRISLTFPLREKAIAFIMHGGKIHFPLHMRLTSARFLITKLSL